MRVIAVVLVERSEDTLACPLLEGEDVEVIVVDNASEDGPPRPSRASS